MPVLFLCAAMLWLLAGISPAAAHAGHGHSAAVAAAASVHHATASVAASELRAAPVDDHTCPDANHLGCCAGMASCVTGCGATALLDEPPTIGAQRALPVLSHLTYSRAGVLLRPAAPPPRSLL